MTGELPVTPAGPVSPGPAPADPNSPGPVPLAAVAAPRVLPADESKAEPETRLSRKKAAGRRRVRSIARVIAAGMALVMLVGTGILWTYLRSTDNAFAQIAALDLDSTDVVNPEQQYGDETYLIVGTDTRIGASGLVGAGTVADAEGARSDTVILVNIPADRSRVVAVSFPRDLDIERPVCNAWDPATGEYSSETYGEASGDKLNAAYALGGPKCLVKVIQKLSGMRVGHFVGIDFAGFEQMVDTIGGVEVCTTEPLIDSELGPVLPQAGRQTISGQTALNYVRARYVESEGTGDYGRIKRQQLFLSALLRQALSGHVLLDPTKLNGFIDAFTANTFVENVRTQDLLSLGQSLQGVEAGAVTFLTVPTSGTNEWGNEIPRLDDIDAIFKAIIEDLPLPGEEVPVERTSTPPAPEPLAASVPELAAVSPYSIAIHVSNASNQSGLAAVTANTLTQYGYTVSGTGNYTGSSAGVVVRYPVGYEAEAATVAASLPGAVVTEATDVTAGVEVVLGSQFDGTVLAPPAVGTPITDVHLSGADPGVELPPDLSYTNAGDDTCA
ncbi:LCP family protein [Millisia brevis]|uniref:LCP family protein n=1 Tax=Millisia brevis TaxID=264148 RepID=UPI0009FE2199|nr:LCP family protein [Millisia brevis]